jgi:tetratricopeptide (TPR) repeat protein
MKAKDQNQFPRFQQRHSFNSTGWVLFVKGLRDEKSLAEAEEMLKRAEKIGRAQSDPAINTIYGNLCLYYLVRGDLDRAQINLQRLADISSKELSKFRMELKTERESEWAKRIRQKRPSYEKDLETLFENVKGS